MILRGKRYALKKQRRRNLNLSRVELTVDPCYKGMSEINKAET